MAAERVAGGKRKVTGTGRERCITQPARVCVSGITPGRAEITGASGRAAQQTPLLARGAGEGEQPGCEGSGAKE